MPLAIKLFSLLSKTLNPFIMANAKYTLQYFSVACDNRDELVAMQKKINKWATDKLLVEKPEVISNTATHYLFKVILLDLRGKG